MSTIQDLEIPSIARLRLAVEKMDSDSSGMPPWRDRRTRTPNMLFYRFVEAYEESNCPGCPLSANTVTLVLAWLLTADSGSMATLLELRESTADSDDDRIFMGIATAMNEALSEQSALVRSIAQVSQQIACIDDKRAQGILRTLVAANLVGAGDAFLYLGATSKNEMAADNVPLG